MRRKSFSSLCLYRRLSDGQTYTTNSEAKAEDGGRLYIEYKCEI